MIFSLFGIQVIIMSKNYLQTIKYHEININSLIVFFKNFSFKF